MGHVRGTTAWQHARLEKKIINHDRGGTNVMCAQLDCEKDACSLFEVRINTAALGQPPNYRTYAFCTERCKQYWIHAALRPGSGNNLPAGMRRSIM